MNKTAQDMVKAGLLSFPKDPNAVKSPNRVREYKPYYDYDEPIKPAKKMPVLTSPARMEYLQEMCKQGKALYFRYPLWDVWLYSAKPLWIPEVLYTFRNQKPGTIADRTLPVGQYNTRAK